jgi:hypothetical protein
MVHVLRHHALERLMLFNGNLLLAILESTVGKVSCLSVHVTKCAAERIVCVLDYNGVRKILCITLSCCFPYTCYFYESYSVDIVTRPMTFGTERSSLNCYGCQLNCCT